MTFPKHPNPADPWPDLGQPTEDFIPQGERPPQGEPEGAYYQPWDYEQYRGEPEEYWNDPGRIVRYWNATRAPLPGQEAPAWAGAIQEAYDYLKNRPENIGRPWYEWGKLAADDPVRQALRRLPAPPPEQRISDEMDMTFLGDQPDEEIPISKEEAAKVFPPDVVSAFKTDASGQYVSVPVKMISQITQQEPEQVKQIYQPGQATAAQPERNEYGYTPEAWAILPQEQKDFLKILPVGQGLMQVGQGALIGSGFAGPVGAIAGAVGGGVLSVAAIDEQKKLAAWYEQAAKNRAAGLPDPPDKPGTPISDAMMLFDIPREGLERALGTVYQIGAELAEGNTDAALGILRNIRPAWQAAHEYYNIAGAGTAVDQNNQVVRTNQYGLVVGPDGKWRRPERTVVFGTEGATEIQRGYVAEELRQMRNAIASGEKTPEQVYSELEGKYGVGGQVRELVSGFVLDPLNLLPEVTAKGIGKIGEMTGRPALAQAMKAGSVMEGLQEYGARLRQMPPEEVARVSAVERMFAGYADWGRSTTTLRDYQRPGKGVLNYLFTLTPKARATEVVNNATEALHMLFASEKDPEMIMKLALGLTEIKPGEAVQIAEGVQFGKYFQSAEAQPISLAWKDQRKPILELYNQYKAAEAQRSLIMKIAEVVGDGTDNAPEKLVADLHDGDAARADAIYTQLKNAIKAKADAGDQAAAALLRQMESDRNMSGATLKKWADMFSDENGPALRPEKFRLQMVNLIEAGVEKWTVDWFGVKPDHWFFRASNLIKQVQSIALLGFNPTYLANNGINNLVTMAWDGTMGLSTHSQRAAWLKAMGVSPSRLRAGATMGDIAQGDILHGKAGQEIRRASTAGGALQAASDLVGKTERIQVMARISQDMERASSEMATYHAMREFWERTWSAGNGFDKVPPSLRQVLDGYQPGLADKIERAIARGMNKQQIETEIFGTLNRRSLSDVLRPEERSLLSRIPGLYDQLEKDLARAQSPTDVRRAFRTATERVQTEISASLVRKARAMAEQQALRVHVEGVQGALDGFDQIAGTRRDFWLQHFERMRQIFEEADKLSGYERDLYIENAMRAEQQLWGDFQNQEGARLLGVIQSLKPDNPQHAALEQMYLDQHAIWDGYFKEEARLYAELREWRRAAQRDPEEVNARYREVEDKLDELYIRANTDADAAQGVIDGIFADLFDKQFPGSREQGLAWRRSIQEVRSQQEAAMRYFRTGKGDPGKWKAEIDRITDGKGLRGMNRTMRDAAWKEFVEKVYGPLIREQADATHRGGGAMLTEPKPPEPKPGGGGEEIDITAVQEARRVEIRAKAEAAVKQVHEGDIVYDSGEEMGVVFRVDNGKVYVEITEDTPQKGNTFVLEGTDLVSEDATFSIKPKEGEQTPVASTATRPEPAEGIPTMFTKDMHRQLRELGYTPADVKKMTPADAWELIRTNRRKPNRGTGGRLPKNVDEAKRMYQEAKERRDFEYTTFHDNRSGMLNDAAFERDFAAAKAAGESPVVAMLDVRGLHLTNKLFKEVTGDAYLAAVFQAFLDEGVQIYRHGGDEMIAMFGDEATANAKMRAITDRIENAIIISEGVAYTGGKAHYGLGQDYTEAEAAQLAAYNADPLHDLYARDKYALRRAEPRAPGTDDLAAEGVDTGTAGTTGTGRQTAQQRAAVQRAKPKRKPRLAEHNAENPVPPLRDADGVISQEAIARTPGILAQLPPEIQKRIRETADALTSAANEQPYQKRGVIPHENDNDVTIIPTQAWGPVVQEMVRDAANLTGVEIQHGKLLRALADIAAGDDSSGDVYHWAAKEIVLNALGGLYADPMHDYTSPRFWWDMGDREGAIRVMEEYARHEAAATGEEPILDWGVFGDEKTQGEALDYYMEVYLPKQSPIPDAADIAAVMEENDLVVVTEAGDILEPEDVRARAAEATPEPEAVQPVADEQMRSEVRRLAHEQGINNDRHLINAVVKYGGYNVTSMDQITPDMARVAFARRSIAKHAAGEDWSDFDRRVVEARAAELEENSRVMELHAPRKYSRDAFLRDMEDQIGSEEASAVLAVWDQIADTWAKQNGKTREDWYETFLLERGGVGEAEGLAQVRWQDDQNQAGWIERFREWGMPEEVIQRMSLKQYSLAQQWYDTTRKNTQMRGEPHSYANLHPVWKEKIERVEAPLAQPTAQPKQPKGSIRFISDGRAVIRAFESADVSTFIHEPAHLWLTQLSEADRGVVLRWLREDGIEIGNDIDFTDVENPAVVRAQERFARGFERYMAEGKAPTPKLQAVFDRFKNWMISIYQKITGSDIDVKVSDEVRAMFDRWMGKEEAGGEKQPWQMTEGEYMDMQLLKAGGENASPALAASVLKTAQLVWQRSVRKAIVDDLNPEAARLHPDEYQKYLPAIRLYNPWMLTLEEYARANGYVKTKVRRSYGVAEDEIIQTGLDKAKKPHRKIVEAALREGKPVPPEVLADYPDLAEKYAPAPEPPAPRPPSIWAKPTQPEQLPTIEAKKVEGDQTTGTMFEQGQPRQAATMLERDRMIYDAVVADLKAGNQVPIPSYGKRRVLASPDAIRFTSRGIEIYQGRRGGKEEWGLMSGLGELDVWAKHYGIEDSTSFSMRTTPKDWTPPAEPEAPGFSIYDYNDWARSLAVDYTRAELEARLRKAQKELPEAARTHLNAIEKTTSMSSRAQARAHAGNIVSGLGEEIEAIKQALEIYDSYPEHTKEGGGVYTPAPEAKPTAPEYQMGDRVMYNGEEWQVGFVRGRDIRLQKSGMADRPPDAHVHPEDITPVAPKQPGQLFQTAPEPPPAVGAPLGTTDKMIDPPIEEAQYEGMLRDILPMLSRAEQGLLEPGTVHDVGTLPPEAQKALRGYLGKVYGQMGDTKMAMTRYGQSRRDFALLNYTRRYGIDNVLGSIMPYQFWYTRSMFNWALRALDKPAILANYARLQNLTRGQTERDGYPTRLRKKNFISMPFLPDWMGGGVYVDPYRQIFPFEQITRPFEQYAEEQNMLTRRISGNLQRMVEDEEITAEQAAQAEQSKSGQAYERAKAQAQNDIDQEIVNPLDFAFALSSPSLPIQWAYQSAMGRKDRISQLPISRLIQTATSAVGWGGPGGMDIEAPIRKALNLPQNNVWAVDRMLASMVAEPGTKWTADDAKRAMIDRKGPMYDEALSRNARIGQIKYLGAPFSLDFFPEGEANQRALQKEYAAALDAKEQGDATALTRFYDEYPEYAARVASFDKPEERLKYFLISEVWAGWRELPALDRDKVQEQFGDTFQDAFLNKETRSYDSISLTTLATWAKALKRNLPEAAPDAADLPLHLTDPETSDAYNQYLTERKRLFPNISKKQTILYALPEDKQDAYRAANPDLAAYDKWRDQYLAQHSAIIPYAVGEKSELYGYPASVQTQVYQYRAEKERRYPNVDRLTSQYFAIAEDDDLGREQFKKEHPQLEQFWEWRREYAGDHTQIAHFVLSDKTLEDAIKGKSYSRIPAQLQGFMDNYYQTRDRMFPGLTKLLDQYYNLPEGSPQRKAMYQQYPQIKQYYQWRDLVAHSFPEAAPYLYSTQTLANKILSPEQAQKIMAQFTPAMKRSFMGMVYANEDLTPGARAQLERIWNEQGRPFGDFDLFVAAMKESLAQ